MDYPYISHMATTTHKEPTMNYELSINIRKALLELTQLKGRNAFLPGVYEETIARQTAMLNEAVKAAAAAA